jgi:tetratricopeptide (TPR) repeat protein
MARLAGTLCATALLVLILAPRAGAQEAASPSAQEQRWREARESVTRGEQLYARGDYASALTEFAVAYGQLAEHARRYVVLHNIALCHERLFRYDEALDYYARYLREGGPQAEQREEIERTIEALRGMLARVDVTANVRGELWIDDRRSSALPASLSIPAGHHVLEVRARLYESSRRELQARAGETYRLHMELAPLSDFRGLARGPFVIGAALTGAGLIATAILGALTLAEHDSLQADARASMHLRTPELERERSAVRDLALATDLTGGATLLCAAATVLLYFMTDWRSGERLAQARLAPAPRGLQLRVSVP